MEFIRKNFPLSTILLIYRIGSKAYGVDTENSDEDIGVVLDGYSGMDHIVDYETKNEYFIFSKNLWIKKMEFDTNLANLFLIFPDEVIGNNPLYIKEEFIATYESYQTRDFATIFKTYETKLHIVVDGVEASKTNKNNNAGVYAGIAIGGVVIIGGGTAITLTLIKRKKRSSY